MRITNLAASAFGVLSVSAAVGLGQAPVMSPRQCGGCGKTHFAPGITHYHNMRSSGRQREYSVHIPSDYDEDNAHPLVLGFHGSDSVGFFFEVDTKMSESRFSGNKIMVYPNGVGGSWAGANYSEVSVQEDLQFVSDLLNELRANYCIDNSRIYAAGMSNGGGFVNAIACNAVGGEFAALASGSGAYYAETGWGDACSPARTPLPIFSIHGGNDKSVYYDGGEGSGGQLPAISDWLEDWATRNECVDKKVEDSFEGDVHHFSWTCGDTGEGVQQHWKIDSMGHCWADTEINFSQLAAGEGPTHIQASSLIMKFFDQHTNICK